MQRILPPMLKKIQQARISSANFLHRKLNGKSSILPGESIQRHPKKAQRTIVSIGFILCGNFEKVF